MSEVPFQLNDDAAVTVSRVGRSGYAVSRIECVFRNPTQVVASGLAQSYEADRTNLYPGVRAPVPAHFSAAFRVWLARLLIRQGVLAANRTFRSGTSWFSVVTTASADLLPIQRIPHYDSTDPALFAAVIYLCDTRFCGTSFYRHRKTGYEEITAANRSNYQLALDSELRLQGPPRKAYINGDSPLFEAVFLNELEFNSAIVYPGRVLHAGNIESPFSPPRSRDEWRLTLTALLATGENTL